MFRCFICAHKNTSHSNAIRYSIIITEKQSRFTLDCFSVIGKLKIQTHPQQGQGSDFHTLVRVFLQDFCKNTVKSRVFMCVKRTISWKVGSDSEPSWVRLQTNRRTERDFSRKRRNDGACDRFLCKQKSERSKVRSDVVRMTGLEPARRETPEPKSGTSANSATSAYFIYYHVDRTFVK